MTAQQVLTEGTVIDVAKLVGNYLAIVALSGGVAWGATEAFGSLERFAKSKPGLSLVFGPVAALIFWALGLLPDVTTDASPVGGSELMTHATNAALAVLCGFAGTWLARKGNDRIAKPARRFLGR